MYLVSVGEQGRMDRDLQRTHIACIDLSVRAAGVREQLRERDWKREERGERKSDEVRRERREGRAGRRECMHV